MSNIIIWDLDNSSQENQENFERIADWWSKRKGQRIKHFTFSGSKGNGSFNTEESLIIHNPSLAANSISYNGSTPIKVKRLELNTNTQSLKINTSNSTIIEIQVVTFTA
jgi:hypothetical protein